MTVENSNSNSGRIKLAARRSKKFKFRHSPGKAKNPCLSIAYKKMDSRASFRMTLYQQAAIIIFNRPN